MHAGLLVCFVFYFLLCLCAYFKREKKWQKDTKTNKKREKEKEREAMQPGGNIILPSQRDAGFKTLDSHSTRESMVLLCHV